MAVTDETYRPMDHAGLVVLSFDECLELLAAQPVGRVAFAQSGDIEIFPVNHCVVDGTVAFRVADGSKLGAAIQGSVVAFEVDAYDTGRREGWSVVVKGRAELVADEATLARLRATGLQPWASRVPRQEWIVVRADAVSGRRL